MANNKNWQINDSGILRKKEVPKEELLVFGYSCKLFRDDERALFIDQGKHLIPWMGDDSLKIDRYDARGALYDLSLYEPPPGGLDKWLGLSSEERYVEQMCDEERYRALKTNEDEEALYQEEELKRLQEALDSEKTYGQVGFTYSEESKNEEKEKSENKEQDDEEDLPFIPPHELDIPVNMIVPEKTKLNAIIVRTAQFICEQGAQMEVLLKMKQANNPQFEFLSFGSTLHPYYRHVFMAIKTGRYRPQLQTQKQVEETPAEDPNEEHYLHPSLATACSVELPEPAPVIPNINYKPSADCAYSMLVNKIKEKQTNLPLPIPPLMPRELKINPVSISTNHNLEPANASNDEEVSNCNLGNVSNPVVSVSRSTLRKRRKKARTEQALGHTNYYSTEETEENEEPPSLTPTQVPVETPAPQLQLIIDKMASYVTKNGIDFEAIVKSKGDERFSFLEETNQYYPYYRQKVNLYMQLNPQFLQEQQAPASNTNKDFVAAQDNNSNLSFAEETSQDNCTASKPVPVCFSIKKPKENETLESRSALPIEESSDEEDSDSRNSNESKSNQETTKKNSESSEKSTSLSTDNTAKWMEERLKDKLTATAKEKLLVKEREKQIQLERKKRAAAFLNLLQKDKLVISNPPAQGGSSSSHNEIIPDDVESLPSPSSVIAISDSSSDEAGKPVSNKCNGSSTSHPLIDLSSSSTLDSRKRSPSPVYSHSRKKKRKHSSKPSKRSHLKSSHKSNRHKYDDDSSKYRRKYHSHGDSHKQSRKHKKHLSGKHKRTRVEKKKRRKSVSSCSSSDSDSNYSSSCS